MHRCITAICFSRLHHLMLQHQSMQVHWSNDKTQLTKLFQPWPFQGGLTANTFLSELAVAYDSHYECTKHSAQRTNASYNRLRQQYQSHWPNMSYTHAQCTLTEFWRRLCVCYNSFRKTSSLLVHLHNSIQKPLRRARRFGAQCRTALHMSSAFISFTPAHF